MRETPYDTEDLLQSLIERHPEMLASHEDGRQSLILVRREAGISDPDDRGDRWSLDHLYLDREGIPTLVEVKRGSDTRGRREVVAQMLDYAANARASFSVERMIDWLEETARPRGGTGADILAEAFGIEDPDAYWQDVDTNLKAERLRLVFVSDRIGSELRSIIEFLNRQMTTTEVVAIEVKQYTDAAGQHQTIVPRLVGDTAEARALKRAGPGGERLDHDQVISALREHSEAAANAADAILRWAESAPHLDVRYTTTMGVIETAGRPILKIRAASDSRARALEVHLETLVKHGAPWDHDHIDELVEELARVGVTLDPGRRWPNAPIEPLADPQRRRSFFNEIDRVVDSLSKSGPA